MNWKFWQNESAEVRRLAALVQDEQARCEKWIGIATDLERQLDEQAAANRKNFAECTTLKKQLAVLKAHRSSLAERMTPVAEGALLDRFAGAGDNPLFLGVLQVIDQSYEAQVIEARAGNNTEKQTNMLLGGQEALDVLKKNLIHYAAASAAREVPAEEKAG